MLAPFEALDLLPMAMASALSVLAKFEPSAEVAEPAPESTAQLWLMESMRHSGLTDDPRGVPSSK